MKRVGLLVLVSAFACGGSGGSNAVTIDGLYQVTETVTSSTCLAIHVGTITTDTLTVTTSGTTATETISSVTGSCPGQIDGDHVTWSCTLGNAQGTATLQISATFTEAGVSGTFVLGGTCQVTESFSGARR